MTGKVRALVWEELRIGGVLALWMVILVGAIGLTCVKANEESAEYPLGDPFVQLFALGGPLCLAIILTISKENSGELTNAFPGRILRLPVATWQAVAVPLSVRALLMFIVTALFGLWSRWLFGEGDWGVWEMAFLVTEGYLLLQAIIWTGGPLPRLQSLVITALVIAGLVMFFVSDLLGRALVLGLAYAGVFPVPLAVAAASLAIAVPAVTATRGGRTAGMSLPTARFTGLCGRNDALPEFRTPLAAQQWFHMRGEARRLAVTFARVWAFIFGCMVLLVLGALLAQRDFMRFLWPVLFAYVLPYAVHLAVIIGCFLTGVEGFSRLNGFAHRYPMSASDLARAKLVAVGKVFACIVVFALLFDVCTRLFLSNAAVLALLTEAHAAGEVSLRETLRYFLAVPVSAGLLAWVVLTIHTRATLMAVTVLPLVIGLAMREPVLLGPVWVAWTLGTWAIAWRKRLVSARALLSGATAWAVLALLLRGLYPDAGALAAIGFASLVPLSFAALALDINGVRHGSDRAKVHRTATPLRPGRPALLVSGTVVAVAFVAWLNVPEAPAYIATWRAQGFPATADDLEALYPAPPPTERVKGPYETVEEQLRAREAAHLMSAEVQELLRQGLDHRDYLFVSGKRALTPGEPVDAEAWRVTRAWHEDVTRPVVPLIRDAAAQDPGAYPYRHNVLEFSAQTGPAELSHVLRLDAFVAAMEDRPHDAAEAIHALIALAGFQRPRPRVDAQGYFLKEMRWTVSAFEDTLSRTSLSETDLVALQAAFDAALPAQAAMIYGLTGDRVTDQAIIERLEREDTRRTRMGGGPAIFLPNPYAPGLLARLIVMRSAADTMAALERGDASVPRSYVEELPRPSWMVWASDYTRCQSAEWDARAYVACAAVGAALERYRLAHGDWPGALDALVPAYLDAVPADPYSKRPLRYRQTGDGGCIVYSVGQDQRDDGGQGPGPRDWRGKDIPFRLVSEAQRAAAREIVPVEEGGGESAPEKGVLTHAADGPDAPRPHRDKGLHPAEVI